MIEDRERWNDKYRNGDYPSEASRIVQEYHPLAPGRRALDLAAGNGRNAVFLAGEGFAVEAVDISDVGLGLVPPGTPGVQPLCVDLDDFEIPVQRYDLIVNVLYLNRRLFPLIIEGLKPGGVLIFEALLNPGDAPAREKHRREYYLRANELLHSFLGLHVVFYREAADPDRRGPKALASLVGIRC